MSIEIIYSAGNQKHKWRFSDYEVEALEILASKGQKDRIDDIIGVCDFGEECHIEKDKLHNSVAFVIEGIERETIPLPFLFDVKAEIPRGSGKYTTGGQAICGLKIKEEIYDIEYGINKCFLVKKWQDENLKVHQGEPEDIRHLLEIETDSNSFIGNVKIAKKGVSKGLIKNLNKLKEFLESCNGSEIIKLLG